jgi:hypothetical protein
MSPNCHPCIDTNNHGSLDDLFHHPIKERTNTKKGITKKHAKLQYKVDWMLIDIKRYAKLDEYQLENHMEYNDMNKDE